MQNISTPLHVVNVNHHSKLRVNQTYLTNVSFATWNTADWLVRECRWVSDPKTSNTSDCNIVKPTYHHIQSISHVKMFDGGKHDRKYPVRIKWIPEGDFRSMKAENATTSCEEMSVTCEAVHKFDFIMNDDHGCVCVADPLQIVWESLPQGSRAALHMCIFQTMSVSSFRAGFQRIGSPSSVSPSASSHFFVVVCVCPCCACLHCVYAMARRTLGEMSVIALILFFFLFEL